jgi:cell division protein FtsZ
MQFEMLKEKSSIIKVIGVGGGGGNAVNHMYQQGITGVDFIICNTDAQALALSPIPNKIQLGASLTEGMGAGSMPEVGRNSAIENIDEIKQILASNTKMLFITAGMGGGTGTGASPVIAKAAREMDILTVGIVTTPFSFEGRRRRQQAEEGMEELKKNVDSFLVISNDRLRQIFGNLTLGSAFAQADNILTTAAKGIAEIITLPGYINVDFKDVRTVMKDSGVAIMGSCAAEGEDRAIKSVKGALASPLLKDNEIEGARYILLNISSGEKEVTMDEVSIITDFIQDETRLAADLIWGNCKDESLGEKLSVTIIATGFQTRDEREKEKGTKRVVSMLNPESEAVAQPVNEFVNKVKANSPNATNSPNVPYIKPKDSPKQAGLFDSFVFEGEHEVIRHNLLTDERPVPETENTGVPEITFKIKETVAPVEPPKEEKAPLPVQAPPATVGADDHKTDESIEEQLRKSRDRIIHLRELSVKSRGGNIQEMENVPAYKRKAAAIQEPLPSNESYVSKFSLKTDKDGNTIRNDNSFLHGNVD